MVLGMLIPRSGRDSADRPSVRCYGTNPKNRSQETLDHLSQQPLWSVKTFPLVASSHSYSFTVTLTDRISSFYQRLSHTFPNARNNCAKQAEEEIMQLAVSIGP